MPDDPLSTTQHRIDGYKRMSVDERESYLDRLAVETGAGRRPAEETARDWMSWDDARGLLGAGMTLGAHTITHPLLGGLPSERQRTEIGGSVRRIEERTGARVSLFAYPDGREPIPSTSGCPAPCARRASATPSATSPASRAHPGIRTGCRG